MYNLNAEERAIVEMVRQFAEKEIRPLVKEYEEADQFPQEIIEKMKALGFFGLKVPVEYGGSGISSLAYASVFEELSAVWMTSAGVIGTHSLFAHVLATYGTTEQKERFLPRMATGELWGALGLTEPDAGSDVQSLKTTAVRRGDNYVLNGAKTFITNASYGNLLLVLAKTDPQAVPGAKGISAFIVEKGTPGYTITRKMEKLGYRGLDTSELVFENCEIPADRLIGLEEGQGFTQVMAGLEVGRINVASRAVGVARAAFEAAIRYAQQRQTFGKPIANHQAIQLMLADMYTGIQAARHLVIAAAEKKDRGERCDLEAGMAKLFASEMCCKVTMDAMRIHGGYGYSKEFPVERFYRDAPLMIIGEGTSEIQRLVIAKNLLKKYQL
ncbi:acyl-CoA dehydrogenase family protein [Brevibacillus sp. B_LB10_24]|uniref:acyl-CoA dehydrogenase family protein n=1 Tax=Brevibacillus sp. B_LB10_24 TaxID=3380645 RepID=UPI0038BC1174